MYTKTMTVDPCIWSDPNHETELGPPVVSLGRKCIHAYLAGWSQENGLKSELNKRRFDHNHAK